MPHDLRLSRGLARDGAAMDRHWREWAVAEQEHFATQGTRSRADLVIDGALGSRGAPLSPSVTV